jgi:hypothetical protein
MTQLDLLHSQAKEQMDQLSAKIAALEARMPFTEGEATLGVLVDEHANQGDMVTEGVFDQSVVTLQLQHSGHYLCASVIYIDGVDVDVFTWEKLSTADPSPEFQFVLVPVEEQYHLQSAVHGMYVGFQRKRSLYPSGLMAVATDTPATLSIHQTPQGVRLQHGNLYLGAYSHNPSLLVTRSIVADKHTLIHMNTCL